MRIGILEEKEIWRDRIVKLIREETKDFREAKVETYKENKDFLKGE